MTLLDIAILAQDVALDGLRIRLERERERMYEADQIRLHAQYCQECGTRLVKGLCQYCDKITLDKIRAFSKGQWYSGESVRVSAHTFLKENDGYVSLWTVGASKCLPVFVFSPVLGWVEVRGLDASFKAWSAR